MAANILVFGEMAMLAITNMRVLIITRRNKHGRTEY